MRLRSLKAVCALAVPVIGLGELGAHVYFSRRAPTPVEWEAARPVVAAAYRPGDLVSVAPYWAEPMARWKFGDSLMPMREVARPDATRYARAIEISIIGAADKELSGWRLESESRVGKIAVRVLANPTPPTVTYDFTDHLGPADAIAEQDQRGTTVACPFTDHASVESGNLLGGPPTYPASRFVCPGPSAAFAGVTVIDSPMARPRRCVWMYSTGGEAVVRYTNVLIGGRIHGHTGLPWWDERDLAGPAMQLRVLVDGVEIGRAVHVDGDGWKPFEMPIGARANQHANVEFRSKGVNGESRQLCFEADSR